MAKIPKKKSDAGAAPHRAPADGTNKQAQDAAREAARHSRVRRDHQTELAEDYVELIAKLIAERGEARTVELAARLGVSHVTVTKTIQRLAREGLVKSEPYRAIFLTETGQGMASAGAERHELVASFLKKLGVDEAIAEEDAEGIEHHVSAATLDAMRRFLDARDRDSS